MADPDQHERRARDEAKAAAREAASIGGPGSEEDVPEEQLPVAEAGGGEAEGFERSQEELVEAATQGDATPDPAQRLAECFDIAVAVSLRDVVDPQDLDDRLVKYLVDAHAIEKQATQLLTKGPDVVDDAQLADVFEGHLVETERHAKRIEDRLRAHDAKPSRFQDTAMRGQALNSGAFFDAQPDTAAKLAGFAYAVEHLEIAAYELLCRTAEPAGDGPTADAAEANLAEKRAAAQRIAGMWDTAIETGLAEQGVAG